MSTDSFFDGMKEQQDSKEWTDFAEHFIRIRRPDEVAPARGSEEAEKTAGAFGRFGQLLKGGRTAGELGMRHSMDLSDMPARELAYRFGNHPIDTVSDYRAAKFLHSKVPDNKLVGAIKNYQADAARESVKSNVTRAGALGAVGAAGYGIHRASKRSNKAEKTAGAFGDAAKAVGRNVFETVKRVEPTQILKGLSKSTPHLIAGLTGATILGGATMLANRGKKELGGKSQLEVDLAKRVADNKLKSEDDASFGQKAVRHATSFSADLARLARQHPVRAGLMAAIPGAKAGLRIISAASGKGK